jgi:PAS domain S-box-containing protein
MADPPVERARGLGSRLRAIAVYAAAYLAFSWLGLLFAPAPAFVSAIWPPAGLTLAAALHLGRTAWAVIWTVAFLAGSLTSIAGHLNWTTAAFVAALTATGSTLRALLGAWFLRTVGGARPSLTQVRTVVALVLGAGVVASLLPASFGIAGRLAAGLIGPASAPAAAVTWWLADVAAIVIAGPVLLLALEGRRPRLAPRRLESALLAGLVALVAVTAVTQALGTEASRAVFVLLVPLVIWPAFRFSSAVTSLVVLALATLVLWAAAHRLGPLAWIEPSVHLLVVQLFLVVLAATGLVLAAAVEERRLVDRRLRETTALLKAVTEGTPDVVFVKDRAGCYLSINEAGARYIGLGVDEIVGHRDDELFPPDLLRQIQTYDRLVLESGLVRTDEYTEVKDGRRRTFLATKGPLKDAQGAITGIFGISREITERKLERMLLNGILEGTPDLVSAVDLEFRFVAFNEALRAQYARGFGVELAAGAKISDVLADHPEALARRLEILGRAFRGEESRATWPVGPEAAEAKWVDVRASPLRDDTGHVIGGAIIGRDVTEAREAEAALRASQSRFRALSRQAPVGIFESDLSGRCTFVNEAWCALMGLSEAEALREAWNQLVHPEDLARVGFAWDETVERGVRFRQDYRVRRSDGKVVWVTGAAEPLRDPRGRVVGYLGTATDVSERRRVEDDLRRTTDALAAANRELESFSYSVSHDLRAPLRAIDGFARAVDEDFGARLDGEGRRYLGRIRAGAARMGQIMDDLLLLARVARSELRRERVDLGAAALEAYGALRSAEPGRDVRLAVGEGLVAEADGRLMRLVLDNLLGNAWKYTSKRERAHLEFSCRTQDGQTVYYVRDDGVGFDMAYADKLFGAFQRLHSAREFPGSGIGLATVARIVSRHGGRVWAEGEPGKGATFYFTLGRGGDA